MSAAFLYLFLLSVAMFIGSFLAGHIPLTLPMSQARLKLFSALGAGLLIGTALIVILPEGVQTMYDINTQLHLRYPSPSSLSSHSSQSQLHLSTAPMVAPTQVLQSVQAQDGQQPQPQPQQQQQQQQQREPSVLPSHNRLQIYSPEQIKKIHENPTQREDQQQQQQQPPDDITGGVIDWRLTKMNQEKKDVSPLVNTDTVPLKRTRPPSQRRSLLTTFHSSQDHQQGHERALPTEEEQHSPKKIPFVHASYYTGISLISGFMMMFGVEQFGHCLHADTGHSSAHRPDAAKLAAQSAVLGLVIHAAADGVALGASALTDSGGLELLVFFAIMLHKGPAAFGLCTFLMHSGFNTRAIRRHLFLFSAAAPLMALLTFGVLRAWASTGNASTIPYPPSSSGSWDVPPPGVLPADLATQKWTAILLLFSAGSFIYVSAVHILPEISSGGNSSGSSSLEPTSSSISLLPVKQQQQQPQQQQKQQQQKQQQQQQGHQQQQQQQQQHQPLLPLQSSQQTPALSLNPQEQELTHGSLNHAHGHGGAGGGGLTTAQAIALTIGSLLPMFLSSQHEH